MKVRIDASREVKLVLTSTGARVLNERSRFNVKAQSRGPYQESEPFECGWCEFVQIFAYTITMCGLSSIASAIWLDVGNDPAFEFNYDELHLKNPRAV